MAFVKKIFPVQGMSCSSCASSIQTMLGAQPGIRTANVNLAGEQVLVEYDPEIVTLEQIEKTVDSIGFKLITTDLTEEEQKDLQSARLRKLRFNTILAVCL